MTIQLFQPGTLESKGLCSACTSWLKDGVCPECSRLASCQAVGSSLNLSERWRRRHERTGVFYSWTLDDNHDWPYLLTDMYGRLWIINKGSERDRMVSSEEAVEWAKEQERLHPLTENTRFQRQTGEQPMTDKRTLNISLPEQSWTRIERLAEANGQSVEGLVTDLLDHVQQGVYRSGSWERPWLEAITGEEAVAAAYAVDEDRL